MRISESARKSDTKGGLFRRFVVPQIAITLVALTIGLVWAAMAKRIEERARMEKIAKENATLCQNMKLPRTHMLATRLSDITNFKVGFSDETGQLRTPAEWSPEELSAISEAKKRPSTAIGQNGYNAIVVPIDGTQETLCMISQHVPFLANAWQTALVPLLGGAALAIASAFVIARSVVKPLETLSREAVQSRGEGEMLLSAELLDRGDEIGSLAQSLVLERKTMLSEQETRKRNEHLALLGKLTTSLAHEIKNPASAILMYAQQLEETPNKATGLIIHEETEHILSLVNQWLYVAKPEPTKWSMLNLDELVRKLQRKLQPVLEFRRIDLYIESRGDLMLQGDAKRLEQVFRNLIDNGIQAMPNGGSLGIHLSRETESQISFRIEDGGAGFSETALQNFGKEFYTEKEGGMGLGLTLVLAVIHAHNGKVHASNKKPHGAIVSGYIKSNLSKTNQYG